MLLIFLVQVFHKARCCVLLHNHRHTLEFPWCKFRVKLIVLTCLYSWNLFFQCKLLQCIPPFRSSMNSFISNKLVSCELSSDELAFLMWFTFHFQPAFSEHYINSTVHNIKLWMKDRLFHFSNFKTNNTTQEISRKDIQENMLGLSD